MMQMRVLERILSSQHPAAERRSNVVTTRKLRPAAGA